MAICIKTTKEEIVYNLPITHFDIKNIIDDVIYITAYGDELQHIKNEYRGHNLYSIPMPLNRMVAIWYGDIAKTILANLWT